MGYKFLVDNYNDGDEVFLFGFSRGAYTARVLAGMLHKIDLLYRWNGPMVTTAYGHYLTPNNEDVIRWFRALYSHNAIHIQFLGVWDTVSSVGLLKSSNLPFVNANPSIMMFRHVVAIDEHRVRFLPELYRYGVLDGSPTPPATPDQTDHVEMWFPGHHADVGGGNNDAISNIPLRWISDKNCPPITKYRCGMTRMPSNL